MTKKEKRKLTKAYKTYYKDWEAVDHELAALMERNPWGTQQNYMNRRTKWQDVKHALWSLLTTTKDFLLTKSRLFYESSDSNTSSTNSGIGFTVKPAQLYIDSISSGNLILPVTYDQKVGSTSTTFSVGLPARRKGRSSSGTKKKCYKKSKSWCYCGSKRCKGV